MSNNNISTIIKKLEKLPQHYDKCVKNGCYKTLEDAAIEIDKGYKQAYYDGENDIIVGEPTWETDKKITLKASGKSILFIEFGSGIAQSTNRHILASKFGYEIGGYGRGQGLKNHWVFKGDGRNIQLTAGGLEIDDYGKRPNRDVYLTTGNPSNPVMYQGGRYVEKNLVNNIMLEIRK